MHHTLYLCYFGLLEPLVQTQVLPYLREIKKIPGVRVSILTFEPNFSEKWTAEQIETEKAKLAAEQISWHVLPYHKSPSVPATVYDIFCGARLARKLIKTENVDILHARAHIPAIMGALARKFTRRKPQLIFDIRGFMPEEYTDAGTWKTGGAIYKVFKCVETWLMKKADAFVVLTEAAREILFPESGKNGFDKQGRPVEVIPCCIGRERFAAAENLSRDEIRCELNLTGREVAVHTGSLGGLYLTEQIADLLRVYKEQNPSVFALILTQSDPNLIVPLLRERGFTDKDFFAGRVSPGEVPKYLKASDLAVSFVKIGYATASRSPTKIPEYLACGLPVISNRGVGDADEQINSEKVGIIIDDLTAEGYLDALRKIRGLREKQSLADNCRRTAWERFDLETVGGERYRRLYKKLFGG